MSKARTGADFALKHDPRTVIANLTAELNQLRGKAKLEDAIKELIGTSALSLDTLEPEKWLIEPKLSKNAPGVPVLFLSDWHWGEVVSRTQLNGVNEYNLTIGVQRARRTLETAIYLLSIIAQKDLSVYPGIVIPLGGDMVSGDIHEELKVTNELPTMPTVLDLADLLVSLLKAAADKFGRVFVPCVSGNHGRNTKKIQMKDRNRTSFDWLLYQFLARLLKDDPRIVFYVPDGADALFKIYNTRINLTHGDQFRSGDSIIGPIGPLMRGNQKKTARQASVGQDYDLLMAGHWHTYIYLQRLLVNGSLKGYDEFAAFNNFGVEPAQQALFTVHPDIGVNWTMPVRCDKPVKLQAAEWASILRQT